MKKIFFFFLALTAAGVVMAQTVAEGATILNWDGSAMEANEPLFMHVKDTLLLRYELSPADADPNSIFISSVSNNEEIPIIRHEDGKIYALNEGTGYVYINPLGQTSPLAIRKVVVSNKDYILYGEPCGDHVVCTLTDDGELAFWKGEVGNSADFDDIYYYPLWDFVNPNGSALSETDHIVPWYNYKNDVTKKIA